MNKEYKNYKVKKTMYRTLKRIATCEILAENEEEVKDIIEKRSKEERTMPYSGSNREDSSTDYLISIKESIDIEEVK